MMTPSRHNLIMATGAGASVAMGVGAAWHPAAGIGAAAGAIVLGAGLLSPSRYVRFFLGALGGLLVGYAFFNKGFAYLGYAPLFVGEITLALGLAALLGGRGLKPVLRSPVSWLLIAFAAWGAARTAPYLRFYGQDALRDAVLWGYGAFAILAAAALLRYGKIERVPTLYGRLLPFFLLWTPVANLLFRLAYDAIPRVPGSDVALIHFKPGDAAVHLAGCAAFLALGLHHDPAARAGIGARVREWFYWAAWLVGFFVVTTNRGGLLSVLAAASVVLALRPLSRWGKVALIAAVLTLSFFTFEVEFDVGEARKVSPQQIVASVQSVVGGSEREELSGTRQWRLNWWGDIVNYTVFGDYFWTGKGFGVNLAQDDGYELDEEGALRSPHNGHLTVLARAGVPGLCLWALLQVTFAASLLLAYFRARREGRDWWARVNLWVLAYWTAFVVNAAFDVFMEGPQGGIWFWCLMGFGVAVLVAQRQTGGGARAVDAGGAAAA
jgi:hypothetical protein